MGRRWLAGACAAFLLVPLLPGIVTAQEPHEDDARPVEVRVSSLVMAFRVTVSSTAADEPSFTLRIARDDVVVRLVVAERIDDARGMLLRAAPVQAGDRFVIDLGSLDIPATQTVSMYTNEGDSAEADPGPAVAVQPAKAGEDEPGVSKARTFLLVQRDGELYVLVLQAAPASHVATIAAAGAPNPRTPTRREDCVWIPAEAAPTAWVLVVAILAILCALGLAWGAAAAAAPLFSRFDRSHLLQNERRARIHDLVSNEPGIAYSDICRTLQLPNGTAQHHLQLMEQHGLLQRRHDGRTTRFYLVGPRVDPVHVLASTRRRIVEILLASPGLTTRQIAERIGLRVQSTWTHLRRLKTDGFLHAERLGRAFAWHPMASPSPPA